MKLALYMAAAVLPPPATAAGRDAGRETVLISTTNQNPFIQIYSPPSPAERVRPEPGRLALQLSFDLANNAIAEATSAGEGIVLDGESYRSTVAVVYALTAQLSTTLIVPFVAHSGGMFDGVIEDWHSLLGLSNARRGQFAQYSLDYAYTAADGEVFALDGRTRGLGDIRLEADWHLRDSRPDRRSLALRAGLKLPTGSSRQLLGSGSTDLSLQLLSTDPLTLAAWGTTLSWMAGALWLGEGEVLDELRRDFAGIASVGVSRPVWRRLTAHLQLDAHTAFYDTALRPLGSSALQLVFGGSIATAGQGRIEFAMVENLRTDATPDVALHIGWRQAF